MPVQDRRELILARLYAILTEVASDLAVDASSVFRNRGVIPVEIQPALTLLDGTEGVAIQGRTSSRQPNLMVWRPGISILRPQVWSILKPRGLDEWAEIGPEMSMHRRVLFHAITTDTSIISLLSSNGHIEYLGCDTDMQTGSMMEGQLMLNFAFHYLLDVSELPTN